MGGVSAATKKDNTSKVTPAPAAKAEEEKGKAVEEPKATKEGAPVKRGSVAERLAAFKKQEAALDDKKPATKPAGGVAAAASKFAGLSKGSPKQEQGQEEEKKLSFKGVANVVKAANAFKSGPDNKKEEVPKADVSEKEKEKGKVKEEDKDEDKDKKEAAPAVMQGAGSGLAARMGRFRSVQGGGHGPTSVSEEGRGEEGGASTGC